MKKLQETSNKKFFLLKLRTIFLHSKVYYTFNFWPNKMKDTIKRLLIISFFWLFTGYLLYTLIIWRSIVTTEYANLNYLFYGIFILFTLYIAVYYGIYPKHIKFSRAILFVIGLVAIILGKTMLANNGLEGVYFGDIACVFWVVTLILWPTGLLFTQKIKKQKEEKDLEIIEV